ncbi:MAG: hypothetical protein RL619_398 [Bacteroidota bacterium]|jgi:hypothetical protein
MKLLIIVIFLCVNITSSAFAESEEDLYKIGQKAFNDKDYVTALKYLFAYKTLNIAELKKHKKFLDDLDTSIKISEDNIRTQNIQTRFNANNTNQGFNQIGLTKFNNNDYNNTRKNNINEQKINNFDKNK